MRHRYRGVLFLATIICITSLPANAQSTAAEDSALWKADSADLVIMQRDKSAPKYSKDAQTRIWNRTKEHVKVIVPVPPPGPVAKTVEIHGSSGSLDVGKTMQLYADVKDSTGTSIQNAVVTWSAGPFAIGDVSGTGLLTGKTAGTVAVTAKSGTVQGIRSFAIVGGSPPPVDTTTPPVPPDTTTPVPPPTDTTALPPVPGRAALATLPRASVDVTMPTGYSVVNVGAQAGAMQQAINAAGCRTELRGAPSFDYGVVNLPQKPCNEKYHTIIRTNNGLPLLARGVRQTPGTCQQRQCTRIVSKDAANSPAVSADQMVRGYYFEDLAILGAGTSDINALVRLGINQTTLAQVPGDFVFSHVYSSGTPTLRLKRNYYINSARTAVVDGTCMEGHDNNGDSQCFLGLNGPGPYLIENNYMEASHEVIMFGGGDPSIPNLVPCDITIRRNHITRPPAWKGVWTVKNLIETKNACRVLIEGNVIENNWGDGQVGYALLFKSVNQDGTAPWSTTQDLTLRYNLIRNTGAGVNWCAACQGTVVPAERLTSYDNLFIGINNGTITGEAREHQFLGALKNISVTHNTTIGAVGVATAISFDGQPPKITNFDFRSNAYDNGQYGTHGGTGGSDWRLWADSATTNWTHILAYPPGQWAAAGFNPLGYYIGAAPTHDGRTMGANATLVYAKTNGVVVTDPLRPQVRRPTTPRQSGYRSTGCLDVKASDPSYATKCATAIQNTLSGPSVK